MNTYRIHSLLKEPQAKPVIELKGITYGLIVSLILWSLFFLAVNNDIWISTDFTDSGVGCIDDCLEAGE